MSETLEYLNKKNIPYKQEGKEVVLICPTCAKPKLYMNIDSGIFHCFVCEAERPDGQFAKGNLYKLKEYYGDVVPIQGINDGVLNYPDRNKEDVDLTELVTQHHSVIYDNKRAIKYLYSRGIDDESIERFKIGYVNRYNQEWLSIPIFESGVPKLIKYRQIPPFNKELDKYIREKDGKSILFNGDIINLYETIYIVEGEIDTITLIQNGYENVISGTGGAGTLKSEWYDKLSTVPKLVLIFDPDSAGQGAARDVWAARLGKGRCYNVLMPEGIDINEFFLTHSKADFEELLKSATRFKVEGLVSIKEALLELYNKTKTDEFHDVFPTPWRGVNKLIGGGLKRGRLYNIAGNTGSGKTRWTLQLTYHMAKVHNIPCLYFCLEMPNTDLATVIVQLHEDLTYDEFEPVDALIYMMRLQDIPIYFGYSPKVTPDIFYNTMKEANARYGVEFGVFDNLHRMIRTGEEKDFAQASGMFKDLTLELNIPFVLVCQPKKIYSDRELIFDDIRGARAISDDADHILLMHRDRIKADEEGETVFSNETIITEDKSRYSESGRIKLWFNGSKSKFTDYRREDLNNV